jgi:hypothetical protein
MIVNYGYLAAMAANPAHLTLRLATSEPIELGDFVGAFTSLANEFERFMQSNYPNTRVEPQFYVKEVRRGSFEADIITNAVAATITHMDQILILEDFIKRWGTRLARISHTAWAFNKNKDRLPG